jgi:ComF family protein
VIFPRKLFYQIHHLTWQAIDLLFPPACVGCGDLGARFCSDCIAKSVQVRGDVCVLCGKRHAAGSDACGRVDWLDQVHAWGMHRDPLRKAVLGLKYQGNLALGDALCQLLFDVVRHAGLQVDLVAPVPLSAKRKRERGYNQAALLARPLALGMDWSYLPGVIARTRDTESQVGKTLKQRRENVSGAFTARPSLVTGKRVLLVDDVLTTGATLDSAASALKQAGATEVSAVVVSRAE